MHRELDSWQSQRASVIRESQDRSHQRKFQKGTCPAPAVLTCHHSQGSNAGEGRNVDVHILQVGGEFNNGINPFPKATHALQPVQDHPIAKDEFTLHWVGPAINTKERGEKKREREAKQLIT